MIVLRNSQFGFEQCIVLKQKILKNLEFILLNIQQDSENQIFGKRTKY